jgi:predicted secreted Zn-dependent protease
MTRPTVATLPVLLALLGSGVVEVENTVRHYDISGSKAGQLRRAMKRQGPREGGRRYAAYTEWVVTWTYTFDEEVTECRFESFDVRAAITTTFPRWDPDDDAAPGLIERWERFRSALQEHEDGHARIAVEAAGAVESALSALGPRPTCDELERDAEAEARDRVDRYRRRERRYDEETGHGRARGVRL